MKLTIRWRLAIHYGLVVMGILSALACTLLILMYAALVREVDAMLAKEYQDLVDEVHEARTSERMKSQLRRDYAGEDRGIFEAQVIEAGSPVVITRGLRRELWPVAPTTGSGGAPTIFTTEVPGKGTWRVLTGVEPGPSGPVAVQLSAPLARQRQALATAGWAVLVLMPLAIILALMTGYEMARRAFAPVDELRRAADRISGENVAERLPVQSQDELGQLAGTFNGALERLGRALGEVRRFTADAAHELRTPLAVMRTQIEVALQVERDAAGYRAVLVELVGEVDQLGRLMQRLLLLAREDAGAVAHTPVRMPLAEVIRDMIDRFRPLADAAGVELRVGPVASETICADDDRLGEALGAVLENAIHYNRRGGFVNVRADTAGGWAQIAIEDNGYGIPVMDLPHVLERFYRASATRRLRAGNGLGLSICRAIVEAHGGRVDIVSRDGSGTCVTLHIPKKLRDALASVGIRPPAALKSGNPGPAAIDASPCEISS